MLKSGEQWEDKTYCVQGAILDGVSTFKSCQTKKDMSGRLLLMSDRGLRHWTFWFTGLDTQKMEKAITLKLGETGNH